MSSLRDKIIRWPPRMGLLVWPSFSIWSHSCMKGRLRESGRILAHTLDIPGHGSKDPGKLRFITQSIFRDVLALSWFGQKPVSVAIPIGLAIGEFIDVILQEFYLLDDPSLFLGTEVVGHGDDD
ncbi:hypothetical protein QEV83_02980 [Methylocapsa sp. D3K7]|uniref:hypothetical protein n=1 Tax=Methylocapsa sp. D3K7 TaxID=3041435 RepID=UPI00244E8116|nr:hypothetical protein [Methylocapsa sp. D3K7]WGJ15275.1 hypothetical protein QEV83_02980 [Methylocapsa sp. D3K7]